VRHEGPAACAASGRLFGVAASAQLLQDCGAVGCGRCSCRTLRACSAGCWVCFIVVKCAWSGVPQLEAFWGTYQSRRCCNASSSRSSSSKRSECMHAAVSGRSVGTAAAAHLLQSCGAVNCAGCSCRSLDVQCWVLHVSLCRQVRTGSGVRQLHVSRSTCLCTCDGSDLQHTVLSGLVFVCTTPSVCSRFPSQDMQRPGLPVFSADCLAPCFLSRLLAPCFLSRLYDLLRHSCL
jgi:hypothetical protein